MILFANSVIDEAKAGEEPALKRLRKYYELTQKQADISKAQVNIVTALAEALSCRVEDLVG